MIETPSAYERRVEEITLLCNNAHHLLNAIRPSQARATLEHALSEQAKQKRERLEEVRAATERAERAMENVPAILKQAVEAATAEADRDAGKIAGVTRTSERRGRRRSSSRNGDDARKHHGTNRKPERLELAKDSANVDFRLVRLVRLVRLGLGPRVKTRGTWAVPRSPKARK